jgi:pimeloyl-ACP methyl ester carboxylesterase
MSSSSATGRPGSPRRASSPGSTPEDQCALALTWSRIDRITRFRIAEGSSARFGWRFYPIDDCGHFLIGGRPDAFVDALRAATDDSS